MASPLFDLTISTYSLRSWRKENHKSLEQTIEWAAEAGLGAIEFSIMGDERDPQPLRQAARLCRRCDKLGLSVANCCVGAELLLPPAAQRTAVGKLMDEVRIAAVLGAPTMRHDVTRGPRKDDFSSGFTLKRIIQTVAPAVHEVSDFAAGLGLKTSVENHGFYLQTADRIEKLVAGVAHPNFGVTLDMGNFLCLNQDPVAAVARLARFAVMVHAKDFHVRPKSTMPPSGWFATPTPIALRGAIAGHGVIDIPAQLKHLKKAGYRGYLSLEFEGIEEGAGAVKRGLEYLRREIARLTTTR